MTGDRLSRDKITIPMSSMIEPLEILIRQSGNFITCQRAAEIILVAIAKTPSVSQTFLVLYRAVALENDDDALKALTELKREQA